MQQQRAITLKKNRIGTSIVDLMMKRSAGKVTSGCRLGSLSRHYLKRRASRSDSRRASKSPSRTGPFTLRMMERLESSKNSTRTWVIPPREPVRPMIFETFASLNGWSYSIIITMRSVSLHQQRRNGCSLRCALELLQLTMMPGCD